MKTKLCSKAPLIACTAALLLANAASAQHVLYAKEVKIVNGWDWETKAQGEPQGKGCNVSPTTYAVGVNNTTKPLTALSMGIPPSMGALQLNQYEAVKKVKVDALCRYNMPTVGEVDLIVNLPGYIDNYPIASGCFTSGNGNCEWRFGNYDITGLLGGCWTEALVNQLQLKVRRATSTGCPNTTDLRVKAFRVRVETGPDCDDNGILDACEGFNDCNGNGVPDHCDIQNGTSQDCQPNGVPDECEPDCDGDGLPDDCEVDCNNNGTPDDCESFTDCNGNNVPDECDIASGYSKDNNSNGVPDECDPDCNMNGIPDDLDIQNGTSQDCQPNGVPDECEPDCDGDGLPDDCEVDCNNNGTPDDCESFTDCNGNNVPDECDVASGYSLDCQPNGVPDECEPDCNGNGIPDSCENLPDCNGNGVPDQCDIQNGISQDCQPNGVPDECETLATSYCTAGTSASGCRATLSATGCPSATACSGFVLTATSVEAAKDGLFFYGTSGRQAKPWGNGTSYNCVVPPVKRGAFSRGVGLNGTCGGTFSEDLNARWCAKPSHNPGVGSLVQAQLWYRDPWNTSNQTTSFSDALEFVVGP
jgi:hypothetical protein